jgi:hypothetical protein
VSGAGALCVALLLTSCSASHDPGEGAGAGGADDSGSSPGGANHSGGLIENDEWLVTVLGAYDGAALDAGSATGHCEVVDHACLAVS